MTEPFLSITAVSKTYPGVRALEGISLSVRRGEVVALVGENGAGKSTLMKILGGLVAPSGGTIELGGRTLPRLTVGESMAAGIAFVHQELNLFENLSAAANTFIGREPRRGWLGLVDEAELTRRARPLLQQLGADFPPDAPVQELSLAQRQLVEIAKALSLDARLVIMDEPTSSLTASETERLLRIVERLKADGVAVIYITHRLGEVERCADRVLVMRDGRLVAELSGERMQAELMIRYMIGRELKTLYRPPASPRGKAVLELVGLRTGHRPDNPVDLSVHAGEILGLAGLVGAGRTELARTVYGLDAPAGGEIRIDGERTVVRSASNAVARGIYLVPEDRKRSGLVLGFSIRENITLADLQAFSRFGIVGRSSEDEEAETQRARLDIRCRDVSADVASLSGGNQQKVVLGKWLSMAPRLLIFDEPTRGIDVGAKSEIYRLMRELADRGVAILMISSDMEEVIGVSDRIAVMHEGAIAGFLDRSELSEQSVLSLAVGRSTARELR